MSNNHTRAQKYFVTQFITGAWTLHGNTQLANIWLGTWTPVTLQTLTKHKLTAPMTMTQRTSYIALAKKLTKPLTRAYYQMLDIHAKSMIKQLPALLPTPELCTPQNETTRDHGTDKTDPRNNTILTASLRDILENTFVQLDDPEDSPSLLHHVDMITSVDHFTLSHSAFCSVHMDGDS